MRQGRRPVAFRSALAAGAWRDPKHCVTGRRELSRGAMPLLTSAPQDLATCDAPSEVAKRDVARAHRDALPGLRN